jgi:hypothetical protein
MDEKKGNNQESGMCFDNMNFSELRKLMEKHGIGSLCKEMMSTMVNTGKGESICARFMQQMKTEQGETEEESGNSRER